MIALRPHLFPLPVFTMLGAWWLPREVLLPAQVVVVAGWCTISPRQERHRAT